VFSPGSLETCKGGFLQNSTSAGQPSIFFDQENLSFDLVNLDEILRIVGFIAERPQDPLTTPPGRKNLKAFHPYFLGRYGCIPDMLNL
jgi:hypothetical protein